MKSNIYNIYISSAFSSWDRTSERKHFHLACFLCTYKYICLSVRQSWIKDISTLKENFQLSDGKVSKASKIGEQQQCKYFVLNYALFFEGWRKIKYQNTFGFGYKHIHARMYTYTHFQWASEGLQMKCLLILYEIFRWRFSIALSLVFSEGVFEYSIIWWIHTNSENEKR